MNKPQNQQDPTPESNPPGHEIPPVGSPFVYDENASSAEIAREAAQIAGLHEQIADLKDRYLRAVAETENVRRRAERDKVEAA